MTEHRTPPPRTASLYVRLSKASRDESTGRDTQEADLRALAASHGLKVRFLRADDGESGALRDRPGFLTWLDDARSGRVDHLLSYSLDRVSRGGTAGLARFLDTLDGVDADGVPSHRPVRFLSHRDGLDSTAASWTIHSAVLGALAKSERDLIRSRILRSKERAKEQGRWLGGTPAFGFRAVPNPDGPGKVIEPDPVTAPVLQEAAQALLSDDLAAAHRILVSSGLTPPRTAHWTRSATRQVLTTDAARRLLWSPAMVRAIDSRLGSCDTPRRPRAVRLLSRVLFCAACGRPVTWAARQHDRRRRSRYMCRSWSTGEPCSEPSSVDSETVDDLVTAAYLEGWGSHDETRVEHADDARANRIAELHNRLDEAWTRVPTLRGSDRATLLQQIGRWEQDLDAVEQSPAPVSAVLRNTGRTWAEAWVTEDTVGRNALLRAAGVKLWLRRGQRGRFDPSRVAGLDVLADPK